MDKNAIQKYAVWARNELIEQVQQRAYQYGITREDWGDENAQIIAGRVLSPDEQRQRHEFIAQIKKQGFQQAVEEVAYTWFNRFVALRFMEVNDYLPSRVRVFSDSVGAFSPEILKDVLHLELDGLDKAKVSDLLNANKTEELYRYLLLTQCNALNAALPEMFEKLGGYAEMLLPNNILKVDGVLGRLVTDIPEDDWKDAVQIIGWMYQFYNTEPKQAVFDGLKKNIKITKEKIPAATQLFTPDWIVRYMVENSLGRMWLESHPNDRLKANWKYYLDEAEQTPEVAEKLRVLRSQSPVKSPEDIRLIDPCMGSGHILVYAFDLLMQIYESVGYNPRDAAKLILEKNIYGLDIDRRAWQLAYFALMMKARQHNRRIFSEGIKPQVYHPVGFPNGEEYGSLVKVDKLEPMPEPPKGQAIGLFDEDYETRLNTWNFKRLLAQKYDVVVTNPPYMGYRSMGKKLTDFVSANYPDSKNDLFAVFIQRNSALLNLSGYQAMITQHAWMFLSSFEKLRAIILKRRICNVAHLGTRAFEEIAGEVVQTTAFILQNVFVVGCVGVYVNLTSELNQDSKEEVFLSGERRFFVKQSSFLRVPGNQIAYWIGQSAFELFGKKAIGDYSSACYGFITGNNDKYMRHWHEIQRNRICFDAVDVQHFLVSHADYVPCNKGGNYRKWYGNNDWIVNWRRSTEFHRMGSTYQDAFFQKGITWTVLSSNKFNCRFYTNGFVFDHAAASLFVNNSVLKNAVIGYMNSVVFDMLLNALNPTINSGADVVAKIPFLTISEASPASDIVSRNISMSKTDWDSFETSWDFARHPMVCGKNTVAAAFARWKREAEERFNTLKANEEELNCIFIDIYGLQDELTPEVEDRDVTVYRFFKTRDHIPDSMKGSRYALTLQDAVKSLVSYAVGCIFGRYSLDTEGLAYAGGDWSTGKYRSFIPDKDNILPICDDEYFDDDILGRFVDFVRAAYGAETLEENLKYIADALCGRGTPREVIRNYFLSDFYKDHCRIYRKRPIYWLFDSGRKNGFKALIYLHRYQSDLLARLRTDYVHEQQERYRTQLSHIDAALNDAAGPDRAKLLRRQNKLTEQLKEISAFEEKVHHLADKHISIDLDDGVKKNYRIFADVLAKI